MFQFSQLYNSYSYTVSFVEQHTSLLTKNTSIYYFRVDYLFRNGKKRDTKYTALEGLWMGHMHVFEWWSSKEAYPMILNNIFYGPWVFHKQAFVFRWRIPKKCSNYKMIFVTKRASFVLRARNIFDRIFFFCSSSLSLDLLFLYKNSFLFDGFSMWWIKYYKLTH